MRWQGSTVEQGPILRRIPPRNGTKADVLVLDHAGRRVALKTYAERPLLVRELLGRFLIRRECAVYRAAGAVPGLARFVGRMGPYALATEWIEARPLATFAPGQVPAASFDRLAHIVDSLHRGGVALGDLHHRDVLIDARGDVHVVDLAFGFVDGRGWRRRVFAWLRDQDRIAVARLRARFLDGDERGAIGAAGSAAARRFVLARRLKAVLERLRG